MGETVHEYIGPRCCSCCDHRSGGTYVPHDKHECHPGPQWDWLAHKSNQSDPRGREYCSCSKEPVKA